MHLQAVFNDGFDEEGSYDIAPGIGVAIVQSLTGWSPVWSEGGLKGLNLSGTTLGSLVQL